MARSYAPLRDPKDVTDEEYIRLYQATFRDYTEPLAWQHFTGDTGSSGSFRALIYIPSRLYVLKGYNKIIMANDLLGTTNSGRTH